MENEGSARITCCERVAMLLLGVINNIFFLVVGSSAQRIVEHHKQTGMLGVVNWATAFDGLFAGSINTWMSNVNVSYDMRFSINCACMCLGLIGSAFAPNFWMACVSVVFVGFSCDFGESVALGYLARIRKQQLVKLWGIGAGIAGVLGSGYSALCIAVEFDYKWSFIALLPLVVVYSVCYFVVLRQKKEEANEGLIVKQIDEKVSWASLLRKILYYVVTIDLVYFAQNVIAGAFLDCAQEKNNEGKQKFKYLFPLLGLTQHVGVLLFCSTATLIEFQWLWLLVIYQFLNFGIWLTQAMLHWMTVWEQFIFMFITGSVAGLNYVNTYNMILADQRLSHKEKELGSNITAMSATISVLIASVFTVISEKTYLRPFVPEN